MMLSLPVSTHLNMMLLLRIQKISYQIIFEDCNWYFGLNFFYIYIIFIIYQIKDLNIYKLIIGF